MANPYGTVGQDGGTRPVRLAPAIFLHPGGVSRTPQVGGVQLARGLRPGSVPSRLAVGGIDFVQEPVGRLYPGSVTRSLTVGGLRFTKQPIPAADPVDPDPVPPATPTDFQNAWEQAAGVPSSSSTDTPTIPPGSTDEPGPTPAWLPATSLHPILQPHMVVEIRRGRWNRGFRTIPAEEEIDADIPGEQRGTPWMCWWDPMEPWRRVDGILTCNLDQSFDSNGVDVATIAVENTRLVATTGVGGIGYHQFERGYLSPDRGYTSSRGQAGGPANEWEGAMARMAQIRVWQGYGPPLLNPDGTMPDSGGPNGAWTFAGHVDDVDLDSSPARLTLTARNGKTLTDSRAFGWNKSKQLKDPIVFGDRLRADDITNVGSGAVASSSRTGHPPSGVLDNDPNTIWISGDHPAAGVTEYVEIRLPAGRYTDFLLRPHYSGMEVFVGLYMHGDNITVDGEPASPGWLDLGKGDVPGSNGGWPYSHHWSSMSNKLATRKLGAEVVVGDNTLLRVGFRNLAKLDATTFRAGVVRLQARRRAVAGAGTWTEVFPDLHTADYGSGKPGVASFDIEVTDTGDAGAVDFSIYTDHSYVADIKVFLKSPTGTTVCVWDGPRFGDQGGYAEGLGEAGTPLVFSPSASSKLVASQWRDGPPIVGTYKPHHPVRTFEDQDRQGTWKVIVKDYGAGDTGTVYQAGLRFDDPTRDWILVDDPADMVRVVLRWAGYREMAVESTGVRLKGHATFNRTSFLIDIIKAAVDQTGYTFFLARPFRGAGLAVPVFRMNRSRYQPPANPPLPEVRDDTLLTDVEFKHTDEPLSYIIRVRGKGSSKGDTLGGDMTRRVMAVYRPPWSYRLTGDPGPDRLAGLIKHVIHTNPALKTTDECLEAARLIALAEALAALQAVIAVPGHFALALDEQIGVVDHASAINSRLWVASRQSEFQTGTQAHWNMTLTGPLVDTPDLAAILAELDA